MPRLLPIFGIVLILCGSAFAQSENPGIIATQIGSGDTTLRPKALSPIEKRKRAANATVVTIMVSSLSDTGARFAEDIRHGINGFGPDGVRILPIVANGGLQNLEDLLLLTGIDMAIVGEEHLDDLQQRNPALYGNIHKMVRYVTKLYNSEVHILAREPFRRLKDLDGKRVSLNLENSQAHTAGRRLFQMAGLEVESSFLDNHAALEALRLSQLDAHIIVGGAPLPFLTSLSSDEGLHFIPVSEDDLPGQIENTLYQRYLPSALTYELYPGIIANGEIVPTIASRTLLAVYNWPKGSFRYRRIERFVQALFEKSKTLKNRARHPKWLELNLAANIPGWTRFETAQRLLKEHKSNVPIPSTEITSSNETHLRSKFEQFLTRYEESKGENARGEEEADLLYARFKQFMEQQDGVVAE